MKERIPPNNREAEESVLGSCLLSREALADVTEILSPDDFYDKANGEIYSAMLDLYRHGKPVDIVTVPDELKKRKTLEADGGLAYIAGLPGQVPSTRSAADYARIVSDKASLRRLIRSAGEIQEKCFGNTDPTRDIMDFAEQQIFSIAQQKQQRAYSPLREVLVRNIELLDEAQRNQGQLTGIPTGFRMLDDNLSGLQKSDLIIIAARPSMGKTAFALNIAQNAALKSDAHVLIFSLEMSKEQLGQRMIAMQASVDIEKFRKGLADPEDWQRIMLAADAFAETTINIDDTPDLSVFEIKNKCRRMKADTGLDLVIIDYLQLMHGEAGQSDNRQQEVSALTRGLKLLAREMDCPVIVLSQLSRAPEQRNDHRPMLSDLRESGSIEQDADIVMFLYRDDYYNEDSDRPGVCEVNVAKHRNGSTGVIDLTWVARYTKFADKA